MSIVRVAGADLWYHVQGQGDPLTLLGGPLMGHDQFHYVFSGLVRAFTVVSVDFRNMGASERVEVPLADCTVDRKVADLVAVLDASGIEKTHIWSVATGSYAAIRFAALYPERVASVIHYGQCAPTPGGIAMFDEVSRQHAESDWPTACDHMMRLFAPDPAFLGWTRGVYIKNGDHSWLRQWEHELHADLRPDLRATTCPMLVMLGDQGPLGAGTSYGSGWEQTRECRPDTELAIVEGGTGTYYLVDAADRSAALAIAFFRRHPISA